MGLKDINLKEEYRSDVDDIVAEFFFPCLSNCIQYDRCVNFLSIQALATISMAFDNFSAGKSKLRMITGHRFKTEDLNLFTKLFSEKYMRRLNVLPGITGLLQINERNTEKFEVWYKYDMEYVENWNLYLDFKILTAFFNANSQSCGFCSLHPF